MKQSLHLLPKPKRLWPSQGTCPLRPGMAIIVEDLPEAYASAGVSALADDIALRHGFRPDIVSPAAAGTAALPVVLGTDGAAAPESYVLTIRHNRVCLSGGDAAGLFYAVQTLRQIVRQCGTCLPCLRIRDRPDYRVRGFYHDVARGKVPTLDTLFALIEKMAHYKLNQLQLYIEHTFAFRNHPDVWAGADPLTAEDIIRLDGHCRRHHIELVPSLSTFGHFCTFLKCPGKEHLNELPVEASRLPFSWRERLAHYTLDCSNPESLVLVEGLIDEFAPLFSSNLFNICCDETFDLGRGRNSARAERVGKGRLYLEFVEKIMRAVRRQGKTPMLWGDIVLHHPELLPELPPDAIVLNWDYSADARRGGSGAMARAGRRFYVCPGVHGWRGWLCDLDLASSNILSMAREGRRHGAEGLLNTDWGDCGHAGFLAGTYHGMMLGASAAWHLNAHDGQDLDAFDRAADILELGDGTGRIVKLLRRLGSAQIADWKLIAHWLDASEEEPWGGRDEATGLPIELLDMDERCLAARHAEVVKWRAELENLTLHLRPRDPLSVEEWRCGAEGVELMIATALVLKHYAQSSHGRTRGSQPSGREVADTLRRFEQKAAKLWHQRNRPSEYFRLRLALIEAAQRIDRARREHA